MEATVMPEDNPGRTNLGARIANLREHILGVQDLEYEDVYVPGWDCTIRVRALTGTERAKFQQQIMAQTPGAVAGQQVAIRWDRFWADLVILAAHDPTDNALVFAATDRDALLKKAAKNLEAVASVARRLSGLDENAMSNSKSEDAED